MNDVMLDLETMGTSTDAAIIAIGAVEFDTELGQLGERFYQVVDLQSSVDLGGVIEPSTVMWWLEQSDEARAAVRSGGVHLAVALMSFTSWLSQRAPEEKVRIWGNGANFDNVVLATAYRRARHQLPWRFWNDRCYRTIKGLRPDIKLERSGTHHNALDDAVSQAKHLLAILAAPIHATDSQTQSAPNSARTASTQQSGKAGAANAVVQALKGEIPLVEPVNIGKALRAGRQAKVCLSGGTGPLACVMLVNIQLSPWIYTEDTAKAFADGYNRALDHLRGAVMHVVEDDRAAASSEGGQP